MFKVEVKNKMEEKACYQDEDRELDVWEIWYTNEYQEFKYYKENSVRNYGDGFNLPYGLTVVSSSNFDRYDTCLVKNPFFPIAVKRKIEIYTDFNNVKRLVHDNCSRKVVPLTEDEYWALYEKYYKEDDEIISDRKEIFSEMDSSTKSHAMIKNRRYVPYQR